MASKRGRRHITPELLAEIGKIGEAGGPEAVAKKYDYTLQYAKTILRRANRGQPSKSLDAATKSRVAATTRTKVVAAYLDECRDALVNGSGGVSLGALAGFPAKTSDPAVVDRAADYYEMEVIPAAPTAVREIKARQRAMDLRYAADRLRSLSNGGSTRAGFVKVAAAWADDNGVTYAAFREMGIPAAVLREAGINP